MAATPTRTRIHVGGLGQSVSSDDLRKVFSAVGAVEGLDIVRTKGRSFAYVDILPSSSNSLSKLFSTYNGCVWKGGKLKLEKAKAHYLTRLKREWEDKDAKEDEDLQEDDHQALPTSSDHLNKSNKFQVSPDTNIRIFFPRLAKLKSLPLTGTGKHKYSFQRVETPALPTHFCDCEEHSGRFNTVKEKQVQHHHEEVNGTMNEEEVSMMHSIMNKLFERGNISNTSKVVPAKERDNVIKPIEESVSHEEEEEEDDDDDDDDLIINVVSKANNRPAMAGSSQPQAVFNEEKIITDTQISYDRAIQSAYKVQKVNNLHPKKKRRPNINKEQDRHEVKRNSEIDESEAYFEENEMDNGNLMINVVSTTNRRMALPGSTKLTKVSLKKQFKSCEMQTCEGESTQNEHNLQKKDPLLNNKSLKSFVAEEKNENEAASAVYAEKGNSQIQPSVSVVSQTMGAECSLKQSSSSYTWSQKSSWRELVGDKSNNAFSLSNILQNGDAAIGKQQISDGPKLDNTLDSRSEKLATPNNLEGMLGQTEIVDAVAKAQPNQPNTGSSNSGRGSSWLHKSSWVQLVSDKSNSFSISDILPNGTFIDQEHANRINEDVVDNADRNQINIRKPFKGEPKVDGYTAEGDRNVDILQSISESSLQTIGGNNGAPIPIVENTSNSEPKKAFSRDTDIGETCSFMRSSTSLKEWVKTKASLKGSRKKKKVYRDIIALTF
ncbi:hypothetical protein COLO4_09001 [Corchorus olitorius]|uniref:RRM domain-containing protein n=1 Tax=Corchorus olitorius TaxID=93759 RepID=A0A1R3KDM3_9ROSI|nr:hypothetical protein COLO4_09001 [Corchorus olitorius]